MTDGRPFTEAQIIGGLLTGQSQLFGARVELHWPDGPPLPPVELLALGYAWQPGTGPRYILADRTVCGQPARCSQILDPGATCPIHGPRTTHHATTPQTPGRPA